MITLLRIASQAACSPSNTFAVPVKSIISGLTAPCFTTEPFSARLPLSIARPPSFLIGFSQVWIIVPSAFGALAILSACVPDTVRTLVSTWPPFASSLITDWIPPTSLRSVMNISLAGLSFESWGVVLLLLSMSSREMSTPASCAIARRWRTVFEEAPIAISVAGAFIIFFFVIISLAQMFCFTSSTILSPVSFASLRRAAFTAGSVPDFGIERPIASVRQFIEFAVYIPEHEPQVGQALFS